MFGRAERIIRELQARGIRLRSDGALVWASGPVSLADAETIRRHKAELLECLEWRGARDCIRERLAEARERATASIQRAA